MKPEERNWLSMSSMTISWMELPLPTCLSYNCTVLLLVIYFSLFNLANACLSQSGRCRSHSEITLSGNRRGDNDIRREPGPVDIEEETTTKKEEETHKKDCLPKEIKRAKCLNQGTCFVIEVFNPNSAQPVRTVACHCLPDFEGKRCQYQAVPPELLPVQECASTNKYVIGTIVIISVVSIAVIGVCSCGIFMYCKHIRKDANNRTNTSYSGEIVENANGYHNKEKDINHNDSPSKPIQPCNTILPGHGKGGLKFPTQENEATSPMLNKRLSYGDPQLGYYEAGSEECRQWFHVPNWRINFETNL